MKALSFLPQKKKHDDPLCNKKEAFSQGGQLQQIREGEETDENERIREQRGGKSLWKRKEKDQHKLYDDCQ